MLAMLGALLPRLPCQRPRHLLGVADERGVPPSVALGVDTFDSCYPTRLGRHGTLLTPRGRLKIGQKQYRDMHAPPPSSSSSSSPGGGRCASRYLAWPTRSRPCGVSSVPCRPSRVG